MTRRGALWIVIALLGIAATAAVAWSASRVAGQRIGLSSEPLSVAAGLAPAATAHPSTRAAHPPAEFHGRVHRRSLPSVPGALPTTPAPPSSLTPAPSAPAPLAVRPSSPPPISFPPPSPANNTPPAPVATPPKGPASSHHEDSSGGRQSSDSRQGRDD